MTDVDVIRSGGVVVFAVFECSARLFWGEGDFGALEFLNGSVGDSVLFVRGMFYCVDELLVKCSCYVFVCDFVFVVEIDCFVWLQWGVFV